MEVRAHRKLLPYMIKDHKRGLLLGIKTFGKGSVQSLIPVGDGKAALKLTTARYYTPSGVCIHEKGIEPHVKVSLNFTEIKALHEHLAMINIDTKINETKGTGNRIERNRWEKKNHNISICNWKELLIS